jgi:hypothetical protein
METTCFMAELRCVIVVCSSHLVAVYWLLCDDGMQFRLQEFPMHSCRTRVVLQALLKSWPKCVCWHAVATAAARSDTYVRNARPSCAVAWQQNACRFASSPETEVICTMTLNLVCWVSSNLSTEA